MYHKRRTPNYDITPKFVKINIFIKKLYNICKETLIFVLLIYISIYTDDNHNLQRILVSCDQNEKHGHISVINSRSQEICIAGK